MPKPDYASLMWGTHLHTNFKLHRCQSCGATVDTSSLDLHDEWHRVQDLTYELIVTEVRRKVMAEMVQNDV